MYHKADRKEVTQWPVNPQGTVTSLRASSRRFPKAKDWQWRTLRIIQAGLAASYQGFSLLKSLMELSLLRAPHLHDYFHRRDHAWKLRSKWASRPSSTYGWTTWPAGCAARWTRRSAGWWHTTWTASSKTRTSQRRQGRNQSTGVRSNDGPCMHLLRVRTRNSFHGGLPSGGQKESACPILHIGQAQPKRVAHKLPSF